MWVSVFELLQCLKKAKRATPVRDEIFKNKNLDNV